jgi:hypothetical protein
MRRSLPIAGHQGSRGKGRQSGQGNDAVFARRLEKGHRIGARQPAHERRSRPCAEAVRQAARSSGYEGARRHIALVAFFRLGGSGSGRDFLLRYGPEEGVSRAGREHTNLGLYLALATAATVLIIAIAYNQVIELFPTGGGYRVATRLIGPYAGLSPQGPRSLSITCSPFRFR